MKIRSNILTFFILITSTSLTMVYAQNVESADDTITSKGKIDEVVIVGYGTQKKSSLTGSVATISLKEMDKLNVGGVGRALQGRAPGVTVNTDGGVAGGAVNIQIRGAGSLTNANPLYVIDGAFANDLSGVNMNDIASMEILKDAAAAAIYGSRAANGVVLVTTKRGRPGKTMIQLNSTYSYQTPSKYLDYINAQQYKDLITEIADTDGLPIPIRLGTDFDPNVNVDYQHLWFGNAPMENIGLAISGGGETSTFYNSFNYFDQKSILSFSNFKRYDIRMSSTTKKGRFKLQESVSVNRTENKPNYTYSGSAYGFDIPILPVKTNNPAFWGDNSHGFVNGLPSQYYITNPPATPNPIFTTNNMFATGALSHFQENQNIFTGSVKASYEIIDGLTYSLALAGYYNNSNIIYDIASFTLLDSDGKNPATQNRSFTEKKNQYFQYTINNLLNYKKGFGNHHFDILAGQSWLNEYARNITNIAGPNNFVSNDVQVPLGAIATLGQKFGSRLLSFFGRVNYDFGGKYLVSASIRSDASSKFAKGRRVGTFPSISAGWNVHRESFFNSSVINQLKLRASYGELGANFIPPYSFVSTIRATVPVTNGDQGRDLGAITQLANANLKWETSKTYDFGFDMSLLKNKLSITADYFHKDSKDLLANLNPPLSSGIDLDIGPSTYFVNSADVTNKGIEFSVTYHGNAGKLRYDVSANLSHIKNKVTALGENVQPIHGFPYSGSFSDAATITMPGLPVGAFWGYKTDGLYKTDTEVPQNGIESGKKAGDLKFVDINHDGVINEDDKTFLGSPFPKIEYGLNFSANYEKFDITLDFVGTIGNKIFNATKYSSYFDLTKGKIAQVMNAWTPDHTDTQNPRMSINNITGGNALPNDWYVEDGSYLRLRNIQIGYTVISKGNSNLPFNELRVFGGIQNLFTITGYSGYDPEVAALPRETLNQAATGGASQNVYFLLNRGVDARAYPRDRTYSLGFQLTF